MNLPLLALFLTQALVIAATGKVSFVSVVHRHGARYPIVKDNASVICGGSALNCGMLNHVGKQQLQQLGAFLRGRYVTGGGVDSSGLLPANYDPNFVYSRSTDILRTLQSSDAMLRGMYPNLTTLYPAINTVALTTDTLILSDALPCVAVHLNSGSQYLKLFATLHDFTLRKISWPVLQSIGLELSSSYYCSDSDFAAFCAIICQDIAASLQATGQLSGYPVANAHFTELCDVLREYNFHRYAYDPTPGSWSSLVGSLGQNVAQEIFTVASALKTGNISTNVLREYSAHDTTVMPLLATLGFNEYMRPPFGLAVVLEFSVEESQNGQRNVSVAVLLGEPSAPPDWTYNFTTLTLRCIDAEGRNYSAAQCPLDGLWRTVNSSIGLSPLGYCYASYEDLKEINCTQDTREITSGACRQYRQLCLATACPMGYTDPTTLLCVGKSEDHHPATSFVVLLVILSVTIVGLVAWTVRERLRKREGDRVPLSDTSV